MKLRLWQNSQQARGILFPSQTCFRLMRWTHTWEYFSPSLCKPFWLCAESYTFSFLITMPGVCKWLCHSWKASALTCLHSPGVSSGEGALVMFAVSPLHAFEGRVHTGSVGSVGASWWAAVQEAGVSAEVELLQVQCFTLTHLLHLVSDQALGNSTSISALYLRART